MQATAVAIKRGWRDCVEALRSAPLTVDRRERLRVVVGAGLGLLLVALLSRAVGVVGLPWLMAPLGASAVLVFGLPASPLTQPWAAIGGNSISALVGIACVHLFGAASPWVMALAPALAIAVMFALRCLHPPGGAVALMMVLGATQTWSSTLFPVATNSLLLVLAGIVWNSATGRRYPHAQRSPAPAGPLDAEPRFGAAEQLCEIVVA